jgi:hypothetical protein
MLLLFAPTLRRSAHCILATLCLLVSFNKPAKRPGSQGSDSRIRHGLVRRSCAGGCCNPDGRDEGVFGPPGKHRPTATTCS